jgi:hypothetical protein
MKLASTLLLMNVCTIHGVSNKFVDELLTLLHKHLLPKDNLLPPSMYTTKNFARKVNLDYKHIHACAKGAFYFGSSMKRWRLVQSAGLLSTRNLAGLLFHKKLCDTSS